MFEDVIKRTCDEMGLKSMTKRWLKWLSFFTWNDNVKGYKFVRTFEGYMWGIMNEWVQWSVDGQDTKFARTEHPAKKERGGAC